MKLAVNYSPQAEALLAEGQIEIDLYKCPDWPEMIGKAAAQRPAYVHFPLMAGRNNIEKVGWEKIEALLNSTTTPFVNTHLAPRASDFKMPLDTTSRAHSEELFRAMVRDIQRLVRRFGEHAVILENANWDPSYEIPLAVLLPELICRVVNETGCGLLLDLAHARMSAARLGVDEREYIERLPVRYVRELHVTGTQYDSVQARLVDHFPMTASDWALTEWALEEISADEWARPQIVALEYGGIGPGFGWRSKSEVLALEVPRLRTLVSDIRVNAI